MTNPTIITRVKKYLREDRKLSDATIIEWQVGVCPDWQVMAPEITKDDQSKKNAEACGLIRTGNGKTYDFFNHRITIPIHNLQGQVVGFSGRIVPGVADDHIGAKYMNSPDSPVYNKSKLLFGLHKAKANFKKRGGAVLVEGNFDVIKLHQRGWDNTIASCGTALTDAQAKLLRRFTETVFIMRDGDKAGTKAIANDITILAPHQFVIYVIQIPEKEDPDTLFDRNYNEVLPVLEAYRDGIDWLCEKYLADGVGSGDASLLSDGIEKVVRLLASITSVSRRDQYLKSVAKKHSLKEKDFTKPLTQFLQKLEQQAKDAEAAKLKEPVEKLPSWVNRKELEENGFVQLTQNTLSHKAGIYFVGGDYSQIFQTTNFTIKPLYHIYEQSNNRRLIEVSNADGDSAVVEMPNSGFVNQSTFEAELIGKGPFSTLFTFQKKQFKMLTLWLGFMPKCWELKTLGWQPEGFFAYTNAVFVPATGQMVEYDELGVVKLESKNYISFANSKIHRDERGTDNPYENDLYLKYMKAKVTFTEWAQTFSDTYSDNAPYGLTFAFLTVFKDVATQIAKMPMLYCYGPKGSGKSSMAESTTWLFFSGKNGEKELIKGFNLNPGQSSPFSFFNRIERFRNCPILMNEFDENIIEDWKFGTLKAAYDGEGREVGDGTSFKSRKTKIQKVQGTIILVGQYLSIKDDGSVLSRSISCQFGVERMKNLTPEQIAAHEKLKAMEQHGLSSLLIDLLAKRPEVQKLLPQNFGSIQARLMKETRELAHRVEARLISNYSLILAAAKTMEGIGITLPFSFEEFYDKCISQVIAHNKMLKENSSIYLFWKSVEVLFDKGYIQEGLHLKIRTVNAITLKEGRKEYTAAKNVLIVRFSNIYNEYSKAYRERSGKAALPEDTLLMYMKEQPYYIGMIPVEHWTDKRTNGYVFDYDMMEGYGIVLKKDTKQPGADGNDTPPTPPAPAVEQLSIDDEPEFLKTKYGFEK